MNNWTQLKGGQKHQALRLQKDKIAWLVDLVGLNKTADLLNIHRVETLEGILEAGESESRQLTKADKAELMARMAIAGLDELRIDIKKARKPTLKLERFDGYLLRICEDGD